MPRTPSPLPRNRSKALPSRSTQPLRSSQRTVLIAVSGLSPAILTETVWSLAQSQPCIIPDQIIVLTTEVGRQQIADQLFAADNIWEQLRSSILGPDHQEDPRLDFDCTPDRVKVFHRLVKGRRVPIRELSSLEDNKAIADALVDELWVHTSKPDTQLIASLAGGYKTMSALCLSAMQLLANPGDRVTHVLVGEGFDRARPGFYFPEQKQQELQGPVGLLKARDAARHIQLIDVPVIPLRRWFEDTLSTKPPSFDVLLSQSAEAISHLHSSDLKLEFSPLVLPNARARHSVKINESSFSCSLQEYCLLRFFAELAYSEQSPFERPIDAVEELETWLRMASNKEMRFHGLMDKIKDFDGDSLAKRLSDFRRKLGKHSAVARRLASLLPGKGHWALQLPPEAILFKD